ncbi:hypothetical protein D3C87_1443830 [compost metagenome]
MDEFLMDPLQAIRTLEQSGELTHKQAKRMKRLVRGTEPFSETLNPLCEKVWLMQLRPLTPSLH